MPNVILAKCTRDVVPSFLLAFIESPDLATIFRLHYFHSSLCYYV